MAIRYTVKLTQEERDTLDKFSKTGTKAARAVLLARALLLVDAGEHGPCLAEKQVAQATGLSFRPIERMKKRFVEEGMDSALERKHRETPPNPVKFDGAFEARLIALACSEPPAGRARWTMRLLADKAVELAITDSVSPMTVCNMLKKTSFNLTSRSIGKSRPTMTAPL